jgi:hypothetical protein
MLEALRWVSLVEGCFVLGTIFALYQRVWRFAMPVLASRGVLVGGFTMIVGYMVSVHDRVHSTDLDWRDMLALFVFTVYVVSLGSLYVWFRMPEGRKQRHSAIASYNAWRLLRAEEERVRAERHAFDEAGLRDDLSRRG